MSKSKQTLFRAGDSDDKLQSASFLNDLLNRVAAAENIKVSAPLLIDSLPDGSKNLSMGLENPKWHIVQLAEDLDAHTSGMAWIYTYDTAHRKHSGTEPYTIEQIMVNDALVGSGGCLNDFGIALEHLEAAEKLYLWLGWPLGQGRHISNYKIDEIQLLGHTAEGCLRWYDLIDCGGSSSETTTSTSETSTSTTTSTSGVDPPASSGVDPTSSSGGPVNCCELIPNQLTATVWFEEITSGDTCASETITLNKTSDYVWTGNVVGWCSDPATFEVKVVCANNSAGVSLNGVTASHTTQQCNPLRLIGQSLGVQDSTCCNESPSAPYVDVSE